MLKLLASLLLLAASSALASEWKVTDVHPKVFSLVDCWLSDTASPVVSEINLDAVRANRNQFDAAVTTESGWITCRNQEGLHRFQVIESKGQEYTVCYQQNGGGTFTSETVIRFTLAPRSVSIEGKEVAITVLRVLAVTHPK